MRRALVLLVVLGACSHASGQRLAAPPSTTTTTTSSTTSTTLAPTTTTTAPPPPRPVVHENYTPFATVGGITLVHPSALVERVGFHQSNHDGARELTALASAVSPTVMESRDRLTSARTAADIVVDPAAEIRSPVTGVVKRAGTYTLYCNYKDNYAVFSPDAHPAWEVKILHFVGLQVRAGQRVTAGVTPVGSHARKLAFGSQVDELATVLPAWPHVHVEVVDPSIKDIPTPGGGCS